MLISAQSSSADNIKKSWKLPEMCTKSELWGKAFFLFFTFKWYHEEN